MRRGIQCVLLLLSALYCQADTVDRIVAVVNRQVILQSEVEQTARVESLLDGKPLNQWTGPDLGPVLDRLIDQALLQQQIVATTQLAPTAEELAARLREVRAQIPGADGDSQWKALLDAYGVNEQDVEEQLLAQIRVLRFVDLRFRGLVRVDNTAIATYYEETLAPELHKQGAAVPPLDQVSEKIRQILVEERINGLLTAWLQTLRSQAHIERMNGESSTPGGNTP